MTFSEILAVVEDYGAVGSLTPGGWSQVRVNGAEFNTLGIRSKYAAPEAGIANTRGKTAEDLYCGRRRLRKFAK